MEFHFYLPERYLPDTDRQEAWRSGKITRLEEGGQDCVRTMLDFSDLACSGTKWLSGASHSLDAIGGRVGDPYQLRRRGFSSPGSRFLRRHRGGLPRSSSSASARRSKCGAREAVAERRCIPLWLHPNLIPRDPARARIGLKTSVSSARTRILRRNWPDRRWQRKLKDELGVNFIVCGADRWHDYQRGRLCGCRARVRTLCLPSQACNKTLQRMACGSLLSSEVTGLRLFRADGEPGRNFLRAATPDELFAHIRRLKEEPALRDWLVAAGRIAWKELHIRGDSWPMEASSG